MLVRSRACCSKPYPATGIRTCRDAQLGTRRFRRRGGDLDNPCNTARRPVPPACRARSREIEVLQAERASERGLLNLHASACPSTV